MKALRLQIQETADLYQIRHDIGALAAELGFSPLAQVQICTAVSEIVRNVLLYAEKGHVDVRVSHGRLMIEVVDKGPGIPFDTLQRLDAGTYESKTGLGKGISGTRNLMDNMRVTNIGSGIRVSMEREVPTSI